MNTWKKVRIGKKLWLKEVIWNMKILALNISQDASRMNSNVWKMIMSFYNALEKVSWSYVMKRYAMFQNFQNVSGCQSINSI